MGFKMKKNMGIIDRVFRTIVALIIVVLYYTEQITEIAAIILGIFAVIFLLTSFLSFCPLYVPFKINTAKKDK